MDGVGGGSSSAELYALQAGVYRMGPTAGGELDLAALQRAGWRVARFGTTKGMRTFYNEATMALALPTWFGRNLDALWDVLTELPGATALVLTDWRSMAERHPRDWERLVALLTERIQTPPEELPPLAVVLPAASC